MKQNQIDINRGTISFLMEIVPSLSFIFLILVLFTGMNNNHQYQCGDGLNLPTTDSMDANQIVKRVISYNVENLFDTTHDEGKDDYDFLPGGSMHWTPRKYRNKLHNIARVLADISGWDDPGIIGLCEIENAGVITDLLSCRPFRDKPYAFAVTQGADSRGIEVALIWDTRFFRLLRSREIPAYGDEDPPYCYDIGQDKRLPRERDGSGRNALWISLEAKHRKQRLDVFVVHMPSRRFGGRSTEQRRLKVARRIRSIIDTLIREHQDTHVMVLGDFNENPNEPAMTKGMRGILDYHFGSVKRGNIYNLSASAWRAGQGTHIFQGRPWTPDQILISGNMMMNMARLGVVKHKMQIFRPQYITMDSNGRPSAVLVPRRTFRGHHYNNGYSDHFPVYVDIYF